MRDSVAHPVDTTALPGGVTDALNGVPEATLRETRR